MKIGDKVYINPEITRLPYGSGPGIRTAKREGTTLEVCDTGVCGQVYVRSPHGEPYIFRINDLIPVQQGHPHAEAMAQYAEDAKTNAHPVDLWEFQTHDGGRWRDTPWHPSWVPHYKYRRKPPTHTVNGFEVPAPDPEGQFVADPIISTWHDAAFSNGRALRERGLLFATKEDAIQNAKAMCGIDPHTSLS